MKTIREEVVKVRDSKGLNVECGDAVYFVADGRPILAEFIGIGTRGSWKFGGLDEFSNTYFSVAPRAISEMYKVGDRYGVH